MKCHGVTGKTRRLAPLPRYALNGHLVVIVEGGLVRRIYHNGRRYAVPRAWRRFA